MPSLYRDAIKAATGLDDRDAAQIEHIMRYSSPTLDGLDRRAFDRLARDSAAVLAEQKRSAVEVEFSLTSKQAAAYPVWAVAELEGIFAVGVENVPGVGHVLELTGTREAVHWAAVRIGRLPEATVKQALAAVGAGAD